MIFYINTKKGDYRKASSRLSGAFAHSWEIRRCRFIAHPADYADEQTNSATRRCIVSHHRHLPVSPPSCLSQGTRGPMERASMVFQTDTMWGKREGVDGGK